MARADSAHGERKLEPWTPYTNWWRLSEHTSAYAAIIQIISGEASVTAGGDRHELQAGSWLYMTPKLKHSVVAKTPLVMLLTMFGGE